MILLRVMAVCFLTCIMLSSTEVHAQDKADQLRAIERARLRSLVDADLATARRLHADDFELINPRGGTLSKEQYLRDIASGALDYLEWEPEEIRVRLYGKSAVISRVPVGRVSGSFCTSGLSSDGKIRRQFITVGAEGYPPVHVGKRFPQGQPIQSGAEPRSGHL